MAIDLSTTEMMDSVAADDPSASAVEDMAKKVRKPYTITKSRESWTEQEHDKFLEALQLFDRDWKKIEAFVGSKTVIQIRSHAQKYFLKVQKNGTGEHVPPPRPKRKSAQPYPHKASKTVLTTHQIPSTISQPQQTVPAPGSAASMTAAWVHHMTPPANATFIKKKGLNTIGLVPSKAQVDHSKEVSVMPHHQLGLGHGTSDIVLRAMPDFTEVYSFLGSVFDPSTNGHLEKMQEMAPIDRETVLVLMRNLSINLSNADFEEHKLFLSVYDMDIGDTLHGLGIDAKGQADILQVKETHHEIKQEETE